MEHTLLASSVFGASIFWPALGAAILLSIVGFLAGIAGGRLVWSADRTRAQKLEEGIARLKDEVERLEDRRQSPQIKRNWR